MSNRYLRGMCIACMVLFSLLQETNLHAQEDALDVVPLWIPKGWKGKITYKETQTLELKGKKITEGVSVAASYKFPIELIVEMHVHFLNPYGGYHKDKNPEFYNVKYDSKYTGVCDTRHKEKVCCNDQPAAVRACFRGDKRWTARPGDHEFSKVTLHKYHVSDAAHLWEAYGHAELYVNREEGTFRLRGSVYIEYENSNEFIKDWKEACSGKEMGRPREEEGPFIEKAKEPIKRVFRIHGNFRGGVIESKSPKVLKQSTEYPGKIEKELCTYPNFDQKTYEKLITVEYELYDCRERVNQFLEDLILECYDPEDISTPYPCKFEALTNCWQSNQNRLSCLQNCYPAGGVRDSVLRVYKCIEKALEKWNKEIQRCP